MPGAERPSRSSVPSGATSGSRGISSGDVERAADSLLREGRRPTIEKVRARIGRGSPNTINPLLDAWWQRLAGRLDAGPAALHRLPEAVAHAAEALWLQSLADARRRVQAESDSSRKALAVDRREIDVQSHVLAVREAELRARIAEAERRARQLETEVEALTTLLRKEQASRILVERRLRPRAAAPAQRATRSRQPAAKRSRAKAPVRRKAKKRGGKSRA